MIKILFLKRKTERKVLSFCSFLGYVFMAQFTSEDSVQLTSVLQHWANLRLKKTIFLPDIYNIFPKDDAACKPTNFASKD